MEKAIWNWKTRSADKSDGQNQMECKSATVNPSAKANSSVKADSSENQSVKTNSSENQSVKVNPSAKTAQDMKGNPSENQSVKANQAAKTVVESGAEEILLTDKVKTDTALAAAELLNMMESAGASANANGTGVSGDVNGNMASGNANGSANANGNMASGNTGEMPGNVSGNAGEMPGNVSGNAGEMPENLSRRRDDDDLCGAGEGILPGKCAPMAFPYVAEQGHNPVRYSRMEALETGTLFPGLHLPFKAAIQARTQLNNTALVELMALDFAIQELGLYLTTHSEDQEALQLYWTYIQMSKEGRETYQRLYGPLLQTDLTPEEGYIWLNDPWPWD